MELEFIFKRMISATKQPNIRAALSFVGAPTTQYSNWKARNTVPYHAIFLTSQKTGCLMEWILTGKGPQKLDEAPQPELDEAQVIEDFAETLLTGIQVGFIQTTKDTTNETIKMLGKKMYSLQTGSVSIPEGSKDAKPKAS